MRSEILEKVSSKCMSGTIYRCIKSNIYCQAPGWLKTFGKFLVLGGWYWCTTGANLVQGWVWPFFVQRLAGARIKKFGVGKSLFWCQISFFCENLVLRIHFLGFRMHFLGLGNFDETS